MKKILLSSIILLLLVGCSGKGRTEFKDNTLYVTNNSEYNKYNEIIVPVKENYSRINYIYKYDNTARKKVNGFPVTQVNYGPNIKFFFVGIKTDKEDGIDETISRPIFTVLYQSKGSVYSIDPDLFAEKRYVYPEKVMSDEDIKALEGTFEELAENYRKSDKATIQELTDIRELVESDNSESREQENLIKKFE